MMAKNHAVISGQSGLAHGVSSLTLAFAQPSRPRQDGGFHGRCNSRWMGQSADRNHPRYPREEGPHVR